MRLSFDGFFGDLGDLDGASALPACGGRALSSYIGSKHRIAADILREMERRFGPISGWSTFYDLCSGTGVVGTLVKKRSPRTHVVLVDLGPWGRFWRLVGNAEGRRRVIRALQQLARRAGGAQRFAFCKRLSATPPPDNEAAWVATFFILQKWQLYGRPIKPDDRRWVMTCAVGKKGARDAIEQAICYLNSLPLGIEGRQEDIGRTAIKRGKGVVVYIDPPYTGMSADAYGRRASPTGAVVARALRQGNRVAVSFPSKHPDFDGPTVKLQGHCFVHGSARQCREELLIFPTRARAGRLDG